METFIMGKEEYEQLNEKLSSLTRAVHDLLIGKNAHLTLTNDQVKEILNVSSRTLQTYRDTGQITFTKIGRKIFYKVRAIDDFLDGAETKDKLKIKSMNRAISAAIKKEQNYFQ